MPSATADPPSEERPKNRLLEVLPAADFQRLQPDLKRIAAPAKHVFYKEGDTLQQVYFLNGGVASITAVLADGTMIETATVGREGMLGMEAFFSAEAISPGHTMLQVPDGQAEMLSVPAFRRELSRQSSLYELVGRYVQTAMKQMMQSAACNAKHQLTERCSRWLLMTHDRVGRDDFVLSHEFLAIMLGVRRQSVSVVAGTLQKAGLIHYKHGHLKVLDRAGLEAASCECYVIIRRHFDALRP